MSMEITFDVDSMTVTETLVGQPRPSGECLICGGSELDEAMQLSEFTPNILRCFLKLLNLSSQNYDTLLSEITLCLDCGIKLRQMYVLHSQLIDLQTRLNDFRLQVESDLVRTFKQAEAETTNNALRDSNSNNSNSYVRKQIFEELQMQTSHSVTGCDFNEPMDENDAQELAEQVEEEVEIKPEIDAENSIDSPENNDSTPHQPEQPIDPSDSIQTQDSVSETELPPLVNSNTNINIDEIETSKDDTRIEVPPAKLRPNNKRKQSFPIEVNTDIDDLRLEEIFPTLNQSTEMETKTKTVNETRARKRCIKRQKLRATSDMDKNKATSISKILANSKRRRTKSKPKSKSENSEPEPTIETSTSEAFLVCEICGKTLTTKYAFRRHVKNHRSFRFHCKHCGKGINFKTDLDSHEALHTGELAFKCTYCDLSFRYQKALRNHHFTKHEEFFVDGKSVFECAVCKIVLSNLSSFKNHMQGHNGNYRHRCSICGRGFTNKSYFNRHMTTHKDERNFLCSVCQKSFRFNESLVTHMRSHTGERPFQCKSCPKNYMDRSALRKHIRAVHNEGAASFVCHLCGKENPSSHYLTVHLRAHKLKDEKAANRNNTATTGKKREVKVKKNVECA